MSNYGIYSNLLIDKESCIKERIIFMSPEYRTLLETNTNFKYEFSDIFSIGIFIINIE